MPCAACHARGGRSVPGNNEGTLRSAGQLCARRGRRGLSYGGGLSVGGSGRPCGLGGGRVDSRGPSGVERPDRRRRNVGRRSRGDRPTFRGRSSAIARGRARRLDSNPPATNQRPQAPPVSWGAPPPPATPEDNRTALPPIHLLVPDRSLPRAGQHEHCLPDPRSPWTSTTACSRSHRFLGLTGPISAWPPMRILAAAGPAIPGRHHGPRRGRTSRFRRGLRRVRAC